MISDATRDRWRRRVDFLVEHQERLGEWESQFVDSMSIKVENDQTLTLRESRKLAEVYHRIEGILG
jgi:hypothetical protein